MFTLSPPKTTRVSHANSFDPDETPRTWPFPCFFLRVDGLSDRSLHFLNVLVRSVFLRVRVCLQALSVRICAYVWFITKDDHLLWKLMLLEDQLRGSVVEHPLWHGRLWVRQNKTRLKIVYARPNWYWLYDLSACERILWLIGVLLSNTHGRTFRVGAI